MARREKMDPGEYSVKLTIQGSYEVDDDDEISENDILDWVRQNGECVDWEVEP